MNVTQESLLSIGILSIATGVPTISTDIARGLVFVGVGIALLFVRGFLKLK